MTAAHPESASHPATAHHPETAQTELLCRIPAATELLCRSGGAGGTGGADRPALVLVAHGSRDPRSAATIGRLADVVRAQRSGLDVRTCFLDLSAPRLPDVLAAVAGDGHAAAVVVPLLLGSAFHARVDVPAAVDRAARALPLLRITTSDVLGDAAEPAALARLREALGGTAPSGTAPSDTELRDPDLGVVLASVGSTRPDANAAVAERAARWRERFGWAAASAAHVTAAEPSVPEAIRQVRAAGGDRVAVLPWVLAPGRLPDRIDEAAVAAGTVIAEPIGAHPALADAVLRRWAEGAAGATEVRRVG